MNKGSTTGVIWLNFGTQKYLDTYFNVYYYLEIQLGRYNFFLIYMYPYALWVVKGGEVLKNEQLNYLNC